MPIGKLRDTLVNAGHISKNEIDQRYKSLLDRQAKLICLKITLQRLRLKADIKDGRQVSPHA